MKIWNTSGDSSVRDTHKPMDGVAVLADEEFELPSGARAKCPGTSGVAAEDCNCRCFLTYDIMTDSEFYAMSGRHFPENELTNGGKSGTIELYRKGDTFRKTADDGRKIIDKATYNKITKPAIKKGADIRIAEGKVLERLQNQHATAVTYGDVIYFKEDATVSDVLEEVHHFYQNKNGLNSQYTGYQRAILNEIDAKEYLISVEEKYHIPEEEMVLTRKQLESYKNQMQEMKERGEWDD